MRTGASSPAPARFGQVIDLVLLAAAGTMLWIGINLLFPSLSQTGLLLGAARLAILAFILYGAWLGLTRAGFVGRRRLTVWSAIAVLLLVWQSVAWWLALAGAFQTGGGPFLLAFVLPLLIGLPILLGSRTIGRGLDATPPAWLVGLQVFRILGSLFLAGGLTGHLPGPFPLAGGAGDTLVGLLALPAALLLQSGTRGARVVAIGWNVLGILDLLNASTLVVLTNFVFAYPQVLTPASAVPLELLLHAVSLRQLLRLGRRQVSLLPVEADSGHSGRAGRAAGPLAAAGERADTRA